MIFSIIAEYNPFHNGHLYHISKAKHLTRDKFCIAVMSGNFVQRGEPAICNKHIRTKAALLNGADLVVELPVYFSTASAELFAFAATDIIEKTGIVKHLCFGSETDNISKLNEAANVLFKEPNVFKQSLKAELSIGNSYPVARLNALSSVLKKDVSFLSSPNNILGVEYLKSLKRLNSNITPISIKRYKADFHSSEITDSIASATALRKAALGNEFNKISSCIPENFKDLLFWELKKHIPQLDDFSSIFQYVLRTKTTKELSEIADMTEGLENRFLKYSHLSSISQIISNVKSKRYTHTKLQRCIIHTILGITKKDLSLWQEKGVPYIRVLGFKKDSSELLKLLTDNAKVPVITNLKNAEKQLSTKAYELLKAEFKASDLYNLFFGYKINSELSEPLVIV